MIKAGIMSMQRICNYGSFLQAYGLKSILEELGCEVEFVDYHVGECIGNSKQKNGFSVKISKFTEAMKYKAPIKDKIKFIRYKMDYGKKNYPYLGIEQMNYCPDLDILVIGSDEVFNCVQDNANVGFSPELFGVDNNAKKLISYAASFGNTDLKNLEKYGLVGKIGEWLKDFDSISVRDKNSFEIVRKLTGKDAESHFDPVLVYDYVGKCGRIPDDVPQKEYMILYGYSGRFTEEECGEIRRYAKERKLKILCIGGVQFCCDEFIDCNPFEVIAYFKNAHSVVTDTFHGTILSVITGKSFVSKVRTSGYGNSEKVTDLLNKLDLKERMISDFKKLNSVMNEKIDYNMVKGIIEKERTRAYDYLRRELSVFY